MLRGLVAESSPLARPCRGGPHKKWCDGHAFHPLLRPAMDLAGEIDFTSPHHISLFFLQIAFLLVSLVAFFDPRHRPISVTALRFNVGVIRGNTRQPLLLPAARHRRAATVPPGLGQPRPQPGLTHRALRAHPSSVRSRTGPTESAAVFEVQMGPVRSSFAGWERQPKVPCVTLQAREFAMAQSRASARHWRHLRFVSFRNVDQRVSSRPPGGGCVTADRVPGRSIRPDATARDPVLHGRRRHAVRRPHREAAPDSHCGTLPIRSAGGRDAPPAVRP